MISCFVYRLLDTDLVAIARVKEFTWRFMVRLILEREAEFVRMVLDTL